MKVNGSKEYYQVNFASTIIIDQCMTNSLQSLYKAYKTDFLCTLY